MTTPAPRFVTVHILWHGLSLCRSVHGTPSRWGTAHRWVGLPSLDWPKFATCGACRDAAALLPEPARGELDSFWQRFTFVRPESVLLPSDAA